MLEKIASVLAIIRDTAVLCAVALMLIVPQTMANLLLARGFKTVDIGFGEVDLKSLASAMSEAAFAADDAAATATTELAREQAQQLQKKLAAANDAIKMRLIATDTKTASTAAPARAGKQLAWVFAGKVDEAKSDWVAGARKAVAGSYPPGPIVTMAENSYLHGEGGTSHAGANVMGAIKAGQAIEVAGLDWSHAAGGGWFVWLKVPVAGS